jgi:hypothetical protein
MKKTNGDCRHWAIHDGRDCVGGVDLVGDVFIARDVTGKTVGRFATLAAAAAAFDFNPEETT